MIYKRKFDILDVIKTKIISTEAFFRGKVKFRVSTLGLVHAFAPSHLDGHSGVCI